MDHPTDLPELSSLEGELLGGKYVVEAVLGQGGMGVVFRARDTEKGGFVAIKVLRQELVGSEEAVARFDREARASVALTNDHVARIFDLGRTSTGAPFIVMEHLVGKSLSTLVAEGTLGVTAVLDLALEVCEALTEAHALGIIHRDLKPANVFMVDVPGGRQRAKVLDFGIAKVEGAGFGGKSLTTTGSMIGTPWYMPPEQLDTRYGVTPKADVWSLGATLYNALTGRTPYEAESFFELSVKVYTHEPTPIQRHRGDLPPEVAAFIHACLQKDVTRRLALPAVVSELQKLRGVHGALGAVVAPAAAPSHPQAAIAPTMLAAPALPAVASGTVSTTMVMPRQTDPPRGLDSVGKMAAVPASVAQAPLRSTNGRLGAMIALSAAAVVAVAVLGVRLRHAPTTPGASADPTPPSPTVTAPSTLDPALASIPSAPALASAPSPSASSVPVSSSGPAAAVPKPWPRRPSPRPPQPQPKPDPSSQNGGALTHER